MAKQQAKQCTRGECDQYPETYRSWRELPNQPKAYGCRIFQGEHESCQNKEHEEQKLEESDEALHHSIS
jgi:hypothetical protein